MVKTSLAILVVAGIGLFGYFYLSNPEPDLTPSEKAKQAAVDVGDAVRDKGVASLVEGRLVAQFGLDATRFVHVHFDEGRALIYGLVPANIAPQALADEAAQVPGVTSVELLAHPRPDYIAPLKPITGTAPEPEAQPEPATP
jgi:hypothetical protein